MNTSHIKALVATLAIMLSINTIGFAQASNASPMEPGSSLGSKLSLMADYLDLSDAQRGQVKQILVGEKPTLIPLIQQLVQTKQQIVQEVSSGAFDQSKISTLATQESQTQTQLTVEKAKIMAAVFNILTPDQKAKAVGFIQKREARLQQHLQDAQQVSPSQQ
jgi:Spy/CpxP family protein refolding chaperone